MALFNRISRTNWQQLRQINLIIGSVYKIMDIEKQWSGNGRKKLDRFRGGQILYYALPFIVHFEIVHDWYWPCSLKRLNRNILKLEIWRVGLYHKKDFDLFWIFCHYMMEWFLFLPALIIQCQWITTLH